MVEERFQIAEPVPMRKYGVSWGGPQYCYAEAKYLSDLGIIKWVSGVDRDDENTWYSDELYYVLDIERLRDFEAAVAPLHAANVFGDLDDKHRDEYINILKKHLEHDHA